MEQEKNPWTYNRQKYKTSISEEETQLIPTQPSVGTQTTIETQTSCNSPSRNDNKNTETMSLMLEDLSHLEDEEPQLFFKQCCESLNRRKTNDNKQGFEGEIFEKALRETVDFINGNLSWVTAGLLSSAFAATILFDTPLWIYFIAIFLIVMGFALLPQLCANPKLIAEELKENVTKREKDENNNLEDSLENLLNGPNLEDAHKSGESNNASKSKTAKQALTDMTKQMTEEFLVIFKNLNSLAIATGSNVVAVALNNATSASATVLFSASFAALSLWAVAIIISGITIWFTITFGKKVQKYETNTYYYVYQRDINSLSARREILLFATKRQTIQLLCYIFSYSMAWAVQNAIVYTINGLFNVTTSSSGSVATMTSSWVYVILVTSLITSIRSCNKQFFFCYPRYKNVAFQPGSLQRKLTANLITSNLTIIVGVAFYTAIKATVTVITAHHHAAQVVVYWIVVLVVIFGTVFLEYFWIKFQYAVLAAVKKKIKELEKENEKKRQEKKRKKNGRKTKN